MSEETTNMINKRLEILANLQEELTKIKALYQETLENDPKYQEIQEQSKKFREETKEKRAKIKDSETMQKIDEQIKLLRDDIKQNREVLAQELADFYKDNGTMVITDNEGRKRRFVFSFKFIGEEDES
jgi:phosphoglycerate-specific signal transduction histidine kinase